MKFRRSVTVGLNVPSAGVRNESGIYIEGEDQYFEVDALVDPLDLDASKFINENRLEGRRVKGALDVFIAAKDLPVSVSELGGVHNMPVIIRWRDHEYEVLSIVDYSPYSHVEITAVRLED